MKLPAAPSSPAFADDGDDLPEILRNRPRRPALAPPPAAYFDELPTRVLTRIRAEAPRPAPAWLPGLDLSQLRWPRLRLAFTSAALSAAFVAAFWLGQVPVLPTSSAEQTLAGVGAPELVDYLADPATVRLSSTDLTTLSATDIPIAAELLSVPNADLDAALDDLPLDESYL